MGVPVYNGARYLPAALDALLAQTYTDFELIISDNGSVDATAEIAQGYASRDERVRYVRQPRNLGLAGNFRYVLDVARGELFRWHAADDLCAPETVARCVAALDARPDAVLAYAKTRLIDEDGGIIADYEDRMNLEAIRPRDRFAALFAQLRLCNVQYGIMRTAALRSTGGLRDFVASDIVFLAELALHGTFCEVPEYLFYRRFHPEASSAKKGEELRKYFSASSPGSVLGPECRHLLELWRAVMRTPLPAAERASIGRQLLVRARGNRDVIARELWTAMRYVVSPARGGSAVAHQS
jgi:glycosyltransferase involved in cell wall biosynthesis